MLKAFTAEHHEEYRFWLPGRTAYELVQTQSGIRWYATTNHQSAITQVMAVTYCMLEYGEKNAIQEE